MGSTKLSRQDKTKTTMMFLLGSMLFLSVSVSAAQYDNVFTACSKCGVTLNRHDNVHFEKAIMNRDGHFCPSCYQEYTAWKAETAAAAAQTVVLRTKVARDRSKKLACSGAAQPAPAQERVLQGSLLGKILSYTGHRNEGSASQLVCKGWNKTVRDNQAQYNVRKPSVPSKDRSIKKNAWKLSKIPHILDIRPGDYVKYAGQKVRVSGSSNFALIYFALEEERNPDAKLTSPQTHLRYASWEEAYAEWRAEYDL